MITVSVIVYMGNIW